MGTNYYVKTDTCESCSHFPEDVHIGKSSMGWAFSLRIHKHLGISNFDDWVKFLNENSGKIYDEYGRPVTVESILNTITNRARSDKNIEDLKASAASMRPHSMADVKNGLLRHNRNSDSGVGEGFDENVTYDICDYEFS